MQCPLPRYRGDAVGEDWAAARLIQSSLAPASVGERDKLQCEVWGGSISCELAEV